MSQTLDPVPTDASARALLCNYVNASDRIQIARITNVPNWYFERVVFPGQRLVFEAIPEADLEIHSGMMASSILSDRIPCQRLAIEANVEQPLEFYSEGGEPLQDSPADPLSSPLQGQVA